MDEVEVARHAMMDVVEERRERLANARAIETVPPSASDARDQRTLQLFLQIEDHAIARGPKVAPERRDFPPRARRERRLAPATKREGYDAAHVGTHLDELHETAFCHPVDRSSRTLPKDVGNDRKRVNDVAERRGSDDEHIVRRVQRTRHGVRAPGDAHRRSVARAGARDKPRKIAAIRTKDEDGEAPALPRTALRERMTGALPVSLVVITRDAAADIAECLLSAQFCAEALVVDSGSGDHTVETARRCGARVVSHVFAGFGPQKQFAVQQARHDALRD